MSLAVRFSRLKISAFFAARFCVAALLLSHLCFGRPSDTDSWTRLSVSKPRVILLTDILNEADDSQTLTRFLMYANAMRIEGLIAVSSCHQYAGKNDPDPVRNTVHPEEVVKFLRAYGEVRGDLLTHASGWPEVGDLLRRVGAGPEGFGMQAVGKGKSTSGSLLIADAIKKPDADPLYVIVNAGANCLAQALIDLKQEMRREALDALLENVRVCDNAGQDNAGAWIAHTFPELHYKRSSLQVYHFMNNQGPVVWDSTMAPGVGQHAWVKEHVQTGHGPLGALYPTRMRWKDPNTYSTIEGGGSGNFIGFVNHGLYFPERIDWGGWGGRFDTVRAKNIYANQLKWAEPVLFDSESAYQPYFMFPQASDRWLDPETGIVYEGIGVPVYRWRRAYQNDFQCRMDWCVKPFEEANHNPVAVVNGDDSDDILVCAAASGSRIHLDASGSLDPDGDGLRFRWFVYPEAGTYPGELYIEDEAAPAIDFQVPTDASGKQIHVILEVWDDNRIASMVDYRRIVINTE